MIVLATVTRPIRLRKLKVYIIPETEQVSNNASYFAGNVQVHRDPPCESLGGQAGATQRRRSRSGVGPAWAAPAAANAAASIYVIYAKRTTKSGILRPWECRYCADGITTYEDEA